MDKVGINAKELAAAVGVSDTWINKCMKKGECPRPELLVRMAKVLGCHPYDLLGTTSVIVKNNGGIIPLEFRCF